MIRAGLVFIDRYPAFTQLYVAELWRTNRAWQSTLMVVRQQAVAVVEDVLREAVEDGELSEEIDIPLTASALVGMVLVAALDWQAFQPERSLDDVHAALSRLLQGRVGGLCASPSRATVTPTVPRWTSPAPHPARAAPCAHGLPPFPRTPVPAGPVLPASPVARGRSVPPPRVGGAGAAPLPWSSLFRSGPSPPSAAVLISGLGTATQLCALVPGHTWPRAAPGCAPDTVPRMARIAVIGAGMGAMAAAARLAVAGHRVTVYERSDDVRRRGAAASSGTASRFDTGPGLLHLPAVYRDLFVKTGKEPLEQRVELPRSTRRSAMSSPTAPLCRCRTPRARASRGAGRGAGRGHGRALERHAQPRPEVWDATRRPLLEEPLARR